MDTVFRKFYRSFYLKTAGFIPTLPNTGNIYPGDFFQIHNGEIIVLGNVFQAGLIDPENVELRYGISLNPAGWDFHEGMTIPYSGRGSGENPIEDDFTFRKQVIAFENAGSFYFRGLEPEAILINN